MELKDSIQKLTAYWEAKESADKKALLDKIDLAKTRLANKDKTIEELTYERNLIFGDLCSIISNDLRLSAFNIFMGFNSDLLWKAWRWFCHRDTVEDEFKRGDITKDEYKQHKTCFDLTVNTVKERFFGDLKNEVKLKEIIRNWTVGYDFTYTYKRQKITIFVPIFHADDKDWQYALNGYIARYDTSDVSSTWICNGLDYKDVAKKLQEWMLTEGWKKHE